MMKNILLLFTFLLFQNFSFAQLGCTDPQANNFDANATSNDGSCEYAITNYSLNIIAVLPDLIIETSGLAFFDNQLWTHNDAGNEDKIYQIDTTTGLVLQTVIIANSTNTDWEDLAEDDTHLYIGDFGNNDGDRMDLAIYKIPKSQLGSGVATAQVIEFSYADQTDFTVNSNDHNYDCEAFFFYNDSLHLFSKNWDDQLTRHYVIPSVPGTYVTDVREVMNAQGLITGADISDNGVVALIGYSPSGSNFMWLYHDYNGTDFFSGNKRKISLGLTLTNSQTEAIVFREGGYGYVSSEQLAILTAKLMSFSSSQWTDMNIVGTNEIGEEVVPFNVFPNPVVENVNVLFEKSGEYEISVFDLSGQLLFREKKQMHEGMNWQMNFLQYENGFYFLEINDENNSWRNKMVITN